ncbi:MAG: aspartate/glutamate racemase family protein [Lachnospiraceae bacterium]|nr:aspartate/glutamate racemase family protein [Lachnospiraceae bacterium]
MKIKIIEPVVNVSDKNIIEERSYLERFLNSDTIFEFEVVKEGFPSIENEMQGIVNGGEILKLVEKIQLEDCDGIFINCFDDPAVVAAREISYKPVLGAYLSTIKMASSLSERIAILTTDSYGVSCEERKAKAYGLEGFISEIIPINLGVLDLPNSDLAESIVKTCMSLGKKNITTAVLGCTGMFFAAEQAQRRLNEMGLAVQIVEPLKTSVAFLENMIRMGYNNYIKCRAQGHDNKYF